MVPGAILEMAAALAGLGLATGVKIGNVVLARDDPSALVDDSGIWPDSESTWGWNDMIPKDMVKKYGQVAAPLFLSLAILVLFFLPRNGKRKAVMGGKAKGSAEAEEGDLEEYEKQRQPWTTTQIMALTSYRFHTGFLGATWMPYLLAMEGAKLVESKQSVFMGSAKLIFGLSILLNPLFGLLGDRLPAGRRLFVLLGVTAGGIGIYGCILAAASQNVAWYMVATVIWMLGEAMADVTTETLVPELLPRAQYELASSLRSLNFILGGLGGYAAIILFRNINYSWLYYAYLIVMVTCGFLTLLYLGEERPRRHADEGSSLLQLALKAYQEPASYEGGFPMACFSLFLFSLGSAPMFFLLLMVRDIVGITELAPLQMHFGAISSLFFVMAAVASVFSAASGAKKAAASKPRASGEALPEPHPEPGHEAVVEAGVESRDAIAQRWNLMVLSTISFGVVCALIPFCALPSKLSVRTACLYVCGALLGFAFGSVYVRYQECTWTLLPASANIANSMGFAAMTKMAGVGIGNFAVGFILDAYVSEGGEDHYELSGYIIMCAFCFLTVCCSAFFVNSIKDSVLQSVKEQHSA